MSTITVFGAGLLGAGMVRNLAEKGHAVRVWNRSPGRAAPLADCATVCTSPAEALEGAERLHILLSEDDAVDSVLALAMGAIQPGLPVLDHCTNLPARVAARSAALRAQGVQYLHAPVFMGPANMREGSGLMLIAGPSAEVEALQPALSELTGKVWHVGERVDLAAVHKLSGNALLLSLSGVLGDILSMGEAQGLSPDETMAVFEVFRPGGALVPMAKRVTSAATAPPSFELAMAQKDVRLMIAAANGPEGLVVLPAVAAAMAAAAAAGHGQQDFAIYARPRAR